MTHALHNSGLRNGERPYIPWQMWLDEVMDKYDARSQSRGLMFLRLVNEFIMQRMKTKGFVPSVDPTSLRDKIATWAYVVDREHSYEISPLLRMPPAENGMTYWELFEREFSDEYWNYVKMRLAQTGGLFHCDQAAEYFWSNLTYFLWRYVDAGRSLAIELHLKQEREIDEEERAFLISEGLLVEDKRGNRQDDDYYREAGFYRGDRRYD